MSERLSMACCEELIRRWLYIGASCMLLCSDEYGMHQ